MSDQPDFRSAPRASRPSLAWRLLTAAAALVALLSAGLAHRAIAESQEAERRLAGVDREVAAERTRVQALRQRLRTARAGELAADEAPPARVAAELARLLPEDVRLERLVIDYRRGGTLELQVVARDAGAWDRLLQRLEAAERLRDVELGAEARAGEVRSQVRARWVEPR